MLSEFLIICAKTKEIGKQLKFAHRDEMSLSDMETCNR